MFVDFLNEANIQVKPLETKEQLSMTVSSPTIYIQFIGNTYPLNSAPNYFNANFKIYILNKTLSEKKKSELLTILDTIRQHLVGARVDYEKYVTKENPVIIKNETFHETKSSVFAYTFDFSVKVGVSNVHNK